MGLAIHCPRLEPRRAATRSAASAARVSRVGGSIALATMILRSGAAALAARAGAAPPTAASSSASSTPARAARRPEHPNPADTYGLIVIQAASSVTIWPIQSLRLTPPELVAPGLPRKVCELPVTK